MDSLKSEIEVHNRRWEATQTELANIHNKVMELEQKRKQLWNKQDSLYRDGSNKGFTLNQTENKWYK